MLTLAPTLLLLSADEALKDLVTGVLQPPWTLAHHTSAFAPEVFAWPNVRLAVLDDQGVEEDDRGRLLKQIGRYHPTAPLIYVAAAHSDANERRARTNGARYYTSKPVSREHFQYVLQSFLRAQK